ncbi:unnamed protein product, partial [Symbiodinium necroappetens]
QLVQLGGSYSADAVFLPFPALREDGDVWVGLVNELRECPCWAKSASCRTPPGAPAPANATVTLSVLPGERSVVRFKRCLERPELNDCFGVVEKREQGSISVSLAGGALVQGVTAKDVSLVTLEEVEPASVREVLGEQLKALQAQQGNVLAGKPEGPEGPPVAEQAAYAPLQGQENMLEQAKKVKDLLVQWHGRSALLPVWAKSFWQEVGLLEPLERRLKVLLLAQGYLGRGVGTPPRFKELKEKLEELAAAGAVSHSLEAFRAQESLAWQDEGEEGLEGWEDAAQSMLAIKPSSFSSDVAPSWLVTEAASYSQSEHKRRERARAQAGGHHGGGNSKGGEPKGGKGKGKDKKKGGGKASTQG